MIVQGTDAWLACRVGKVTASRVADVIAKTKTGWGAARATYAAELICERLTGVPAPRFTNAAMAWGTEQEPFAREAYTAHTGVDVYEVGFIDHPEIAKSGASPDGFVLDDGLLEIKCPQTATHLETLRCGDVPAKYMPQIQWQLACTGRDWCDFASYDPRMPEPMRLFVRRVPRDASMILDLESEVSAFIREIDAEVEALFRTYGQQVAEAA